MDDRTLGSIYVVVVQAVIIYGSETWVMTPCVRRVLVRIPPQGGLRYNGYTALERTVRWMGLSPAGESDGGGGITREVDLRLPPPEHSRTVYCDQAHYGPVSDGGSEAWVKGGKAVVGS